MEGETGRAVNRWLLWLWVSCGPLAAEPVGVLCQLGPDRVMFWLEGAPRAFGVSPQLGHVLGRAGLGSCWEVFGHGDRLESALPRGQHEACKSALAVFGQFARELNAGNWSRAEALLGIGNRKDGEAFRLRWSRQFLSTDPGDWKVVRLDSDRLEVEVVSMQGALDAGETFDTTPTALGSRWCLWRSSPGGAWRVKELES